MKIPVTIAFPGLGIEAFTIDAVAFTLFGLEVRWYGILITLGIILCYIYTTWRGKQVSIAEDDILDMAMFTVILGIIGARAYYVLMKLEDFHSLKDILNIRRGGLAIYGGIIVGAITLIIAARIKRVNIFKMLDCAAPGVMLAQAIGRWGNFFNGEAYGAQTDIFCRMGLQDEKWSQMYYFHPTFLYESLWNLLGFALINLIYRKRRFNGQITLMYFAWYGFGRMFIEGLREDSLWLGSIRISQLVAFLFFVVCTVLLVIGLAAPGLYAFTAKEYPTPVGEAEAENETEAENEDEDAEAEDEANHTEETTTEKENNEHGTTD